ncbi:MAG TPA: nitrous oxide-stimulated promoter family protein [Geobacteraceae bacterium]|nr:nitrous oxide-stimulated promoter family protein [Geobacteraceae bacterium]
MYTGKDRINREKNTIKRMIGIYCRGRHHTDGAVCKECRQLLDYAMERIYRCPYGGDKPTCGKCPIHCYKPAMREQIRCVMRYAGPRMMMYHPVLAILHFLDGMKGADKPEKKR